MGRGKGGVVHSAQSRTSATHGCTLHVDPLAVLASGVMWLVGLYVRWRARPPVGMVYTRLL